MIRFYLILMGMFMMACNKDSSQNPDAVDLSTFIDPRDGQAYSVVKIGDQFWFAQNLNYAIDQSWCYEDSSDNCAVYGRLYDWHTARIACPEGWHLPDDEEWETLVSYLGGKDIAGGKMKSTSGWMTPNVNATNSSGFSGLPGGLRDVNGNFLGLESDGYWWSATVSSFFPETFALYRELSYDDNEVDGFLTHLGSGLACRCVRD